MLRRRGDGEKLMRAFRTGWLGGAAVSLVLVGMMGKKWAKGGKFMPAGLVTVSSFFSCAECSVRGATGRRVEVLMTRSCGGGSRFSRRGRLCGSGSGCCEELQRAMLGLGHPSLWRGRWRRREAGATATIARSRRNFAGADAEGGLLPFCFSFSGMTSSSSKYAASGRWAC